MERPIVSRYNPHNDLEEPVQLNKPGPYDTGNEKVLLCYSFGGKILSLRVFPTSLDAGAYQVHTADNNTTYDSPGAERIDEAPWINNGIATPEAPIFIRSDWERDVLRVDVKICENKLTNTIVFSSDEAMAAD